MMDRWPNAVSEFLEDYPHDVQRRWSPEDLAAQTQFVKNHTANRKWLDWSDPTTAMQLLQSKLASVPMRVGSVYEAIVIAGPVVELVDAAELFAGAIQHLQPDGCLIGIVPCLRDNSPESQRFAELAAPMLWDYRTAEELLEIIREAGLSTILELSRFIPIPRFCEAVIKDELRFKGFHHVFRQLEAEGYDLMEVGWGELRFVASLEADAG